MEREGSAAIYIWTLRACFTISLLLVESVPTSAASGGLPEVFSATPGAIASVAVSPSVAATETATATPTATPSCAPPDVWFDPPQKCCPYESGDPSNFPGPFICPYGFVFVCPPGICNDPEGCCCWKCDPSSGHCDCPAGMYNCGGITCCFDGESCVSDEGGMFHCGPGASSAGTSSDDNSSAAETSSSAGGSSGGASSSEGGGSSGGESSGGGSSGGGSSGNGSSGGGSSGNNSSGGASSGGGSSGEGSSGGGSSGGESSGGDSSGNGSSGGISSTNDSSGAASSGGGSSGEGSSGGKSSGGASSGGGSSGGGSSGGGSSGGGSSGGVSSGGGSSGGGSSGAVNSSMGGNSSGGTSSGGNNSSSGGGASSTGGVSSGGGQRSSAGGGQASSIPEGCTEIRIITEKSDLKLGPEALRGYGVRQLKRLEAAAKKLGDKSLGKRLAASRIRADKRYTLLVSQARAAIEQLPDVFLSCTNNPLCSAVDNSVTIAKYVKAVTGLAQSEIRTLNRGSRLVFPSIAQARKVTKPSGKAIKSERKRLIGIALAIPPAQSMCVVPH